VLFMTVPTAGNRPQLLEALVENSALPRERIIIIATKPGVRGPQGTITVEDLGSPNIQRWWNRGIDEAYAKGATAVAVVNDDISLRPSTLTALHEELQSTKAAIASPSRPEFRTGLHKGRLIPYEPRLWGSLWLIRLDSGLRPDTDYVWWYGDNDLDIRARRKHGGVVLVDVEYQHLHPGEGTAASPELQAQAMADAQRFEAQYARLLRLSRIIVRLREKLGLSHKDSRATS